MFEKLQTTLEYHQSAQIHKSEGSWIITDHAIESVPTFPRY